MHHALSVRSLLTCFIYTNEVKRKANQLCVMFAINKIVINKKKKQGSKLRSAVSRDSCAARHTSLWRRPHFHGKPVMCTHSDTRMCAPAFVVPKSNCTRTFKTNTFE